jgi:hypothetical protein
MYLWKGKGFNYFRKWHNHVALLLIQRNNKIKYSKTVFFIARGNFQNFKI